MGAILQHEVCDPRMRELELLIHQEDSQAKALTRELNLAQARIAALESEIRLLKAAAARREDEYAALALNSALVGLRAQKAADSLREQNAWLRLAIREMARIFAAAVPVARRQAWNRPCWICGAPSLCPHRERKLIPIWRGEKCL